MPQPIYKLFLVKPTQAWHQLSEDEQSQLLAKVDEALTNAGGERIVLCNSGWASEQWPFWGVERFPDIEAVQKHAELINEFDWFRYVESMSVLGTESQTA